MNKTAIAFLTKDRVELSRQSIEPLLQPDNFNLFWCDGSATDAGRTFRQNRTILHDALKIYGNVTGGAGAAIVFALTKMLEGPYDYIGLVENDVLLLGDWFDRSMALFSRGESDGLSVGAVSARNYTDRVLFQRAGFSVNHNLGAGMVIFRRDAAQLALNYFRSGFTADNRRIFGRLAGFDLAPFWAFRGQDHPLVADWHWDAMLASHGYASLALTPSPCEMIGQNPPLAEQGLTIVTGPVEERIDNTGFERYRDRLRAVRDGQLKVNVETEFQFDNENAGWIYTPHQFHKLGGVWSGEWSFKESRGFGEFSWVAQEADARLDIDLAGTCVFVVSGGTSGAQVRVDDLFSGYSAAPYINAEGPETQALQIPLPSRAPYRSVRLTALTPGVTIYRLTCREQQAALLQVMFNHSCLPSPVVKNG